MFIRSNIIGQRMLNQSNRLQKKGSQAMERLASGLRINHAADDAAGLSISEGMRAQIRGLAQASRNAKDAQSFVSTTDGVLGEVTDAMQRMRELTIQALSDTNTDEDRKQIQAEFAQLRDSISDMTTQTTWNTKPAVEAHYPAYAQISGNRVFSEPIKIIDGYNNDLEVVVGGASRTVSIPAGIYSVEEVADALDDQLAAYTPPIIVDVNKDKSLSLDAEGTSSIDYIRGGASSLFYEYTPGNPPGMIIGTTDFPPGSKLTIQSGQNDKLIFYAGSNKKYEIDFPPGSYSKDDIITFINQQLTSDGQDHIKAVPYGSENIAITSDKYVISGLSGNMIEIDGITSVIYDIAKYGTVNKTNSYYYGYADLSKGVEIQKGVNDTLNIMVNNGNYQTVNLLKAGETDVTLMPNDIQDRLNSQFAALGMPLTATVNGNLEIDNNTYGSTSHLNVYIGSPAYNTLFKRDYNYYYTVGINNGVTSTATVQGNNGIGDNTTIGSTNNTLTMTVDGTTKTLILKENTYSKTDLVTEINDELNTAGFNVTASLVDDGSGKSALQLMYDQAGTGSIFVSNNPSISTAFQTLFSGTVVYPPYLTDGTTGAPQYPPEGVAGDPIIPTTPATARGRVDLTYGISLTDNNNILAYTLNKNTTSIKLTNGFYTAQQLVAELNKQLNPNELSASLTSDGRNLVLTSVSQGSENAFQSVSGPGMELVATTNPSSLSSAGSISTSTITGLTQIPANYTIDDTNNQLSFTYNEDGQEYPINLTIDNGTYSGISDVLAELNSKLDQAFQDNGFDQRQVNALASGQCISFKTVGAGSDYTFYNFSGSFYKDAMQKEVYTWLGNGSSGATYSNSPAYIVGRDTITDKTMVINPNINDKLTFDFYKNGTPTKFNLTLPPGAYSAGQLVNELNKQLQAQLTMDGYSADTLSFQIGGIDSGTNVDDTGKLVIKYNTFEDGRNDTGSYRIDGVRGSAAYTCFYRAQGDPAPSFTIGSVDLSNGAFIEEGKNDTFIVDVDNEKKNMTIPAGNYSADQLLSTLNDQLTMANSGLIASYYEGKLKLSTADVGQIPIDAIRGNARDTLFYKTESRDSDPDNSIQIGANSGQTLVIGKTRLSNNILRINTITVSTSKNAYKALSRLDSALAMVLSERSKTGAIQNQLDTIIDANEKYEESLVSAESRIRDVDIAKEVIEKAKSDIVDQAEQAMFAQANSSAKSVLDLLKG